VERPERVHAGRARLEDDRLITTEGYYIQKIERTGTPVWKRSTPDENRRVAINPNFGGGYVFTVAEGDRIEFATSTATCCGSSRGSRTTP